MAPDPLMHGAGAAPLSWHALAADAAEPNPFYAPDMLAPALAHLAGEAGVRVIEVEADGALIGLMPVVTGVRYGRLPIQVTGNWMHRHCFFGAPLIRRGAEVAAWRGFLAQLDGADWARGFLHLSGLDAAGANAAAIEGVCTEQRRSWREVHRYERALLRSDLTADAYWEANVRAKKRKEIRRLIKRLEESGVVSRHRLTDAADVSAWCDAFLSLEQGGWKGEEGTALADNPADVAFFRESVAAALAAGRLAFLRIDLDDRPIAMLCNFLSGPGGFSFKIAHDEALARFSPGVMIEIDNLHLVLNGEGIDWMDSCAAPDHPMIDSLWAERRTIVQYRIALKQGRLAFAAADMAEGLARRLKGFRA